MEPKGSKMEPKGPKMEPKGPKMKPKGPKMEPNGDQNASKLRFSKKDGARTLWANRRVTQKSTVWPKRSPQGSILETILVPFPLKIHPKIDPKIDAEKVMKNDGKMMQKWIENL